MCPKVLIRMNVIWRNSIACLRIREVPHRYQSSCHPVAPLGSRILTDPAKVFEHNMCLTISAALNTDTCLLNTRNCHSVRQPVSPWAPPLHHGLEHVPGRKPGDHMQWSKEEEEAARRKVEENSAVRVLLEEQVKYESEASKYWDTFYKIHKNKFFKDRNWLLREFPEILPVDQKTEEKAKELSWDRVKINAANCFSRMHCPTIPEEKNHYKKSSDSSDGQSKAGSDVDNLDSKEHGKRPLKTELFPGSNATFRILEVGCGAGNSVFPILNTLQNAPEFFLYCCDFASGAVELVKSHSSYRAAQCCAFVHDVCDDGLPYPFPDGILDVILLVFVLSSIHPDRMQGVVNRLSKLLKPGGMLLFRDYGRYDKTQLRFKRGHCLSENFYVRGDGTRAYFFTKGEVHDMFCKAGLDEKQNLVDRRLQVNRKKQVKMHRVWVQGKFQKP
ncbi:mRNA N(3)-methylcytidine methyltransferase METTL8 isoform X1 [Camelus ferus]|uniref:mRNA N(3)-methylcytidine methyltransferase METTL8 isoform X1 n=6 Tax=Camelus TaxID=9836 RepID=A0A8B8T0U7_CAMFR|nr:mRNA N(3)-methylcytidine methyltransferase METTL8 isoform X1 [Camelus bactrianus]XP_032335567.1 mRNA N(3)-methylcytidine methyltransferase METTL8 isoform X1 [Camelus ferus]XP_032335568.1 mRNA N(3)-methylcytidine methyltransferase METTL8 isoform X1 [Camelus ferus]XP_032335569.1 mRNA N(3)-methylcytidine methyltransferase METTL8 isoform X1 [Camelus ferus]XP_045368935.1 mRNA N(3)-methylcytidine methyltransferase METTL8 isoform X1 [Camelus bactrianus]XP_045368936.1 mRNA N(3)-methylcytidine methy